MAQQITYLITAATGVTGRATIAALQADGQQNIRVLAHREDERSEQLQKQGVEVVFGDLLDFHAVRAALRGVKRAYFCFPIAPGMVQATTQFAQAAREVGVDAIVNMSQKIARKDAHSHDAFDHWLSEQVFDWSGVPITHLRPTFFAEWLLYLSPMIRQGTIYAPYGTGKAAFIAAEDQGRVIARILQDPKFHQGQVYPLYGPVEYTFAEVAAVVGRVLERDISI
jgi:NAD(P)H dehydrogenase (quinone)